MESLNTFISHLLSILPLPLPPPPSSSLLPLHHTTQPQYVFLHDALLEAIMCGDTSIPAPELRTKLQSLLEVDEDTKKTNIATQFEVR